MRPVPVDAVRRELLIASEAARKLSVALRIAWAELSRTGDFASVCINEESVSEDAQTKKDVSAEPTLPF